MQGVSAFTHLDIVAAIDDLILDRTVYDTFISRDASPEGESMDGQVQRPQ